MNLISTFLVWKSNLISKCQNSYPNYNFLAKQRKFNKITYFLDIKSKQFTISGDCCLVNDDAFQKCDDCECRYDPVEIMSTAKHFPADGCLFKNTEAYQDGFCHDELNNAECDYDGGDCCSPVVYTNVCTECKCHDSSITGTYFYIHVWNSSNSGG